MAEDEWAELADAFVDGAYATVRGRVRTQVLHRQLLDHLPPPHAAVLDVGGGAGHQSLPLARLGYHVTVVDSSPEMLARAAARIAAEPEEVRRRVRLVEGPGERADVLTAEAQFDAVLCHGVLMYLDDPRPMLDALCRCAAPGGLVSVMALNARTLAVRPALEGRWDDALAAFDATTETGVLGTPTRGDTVDGLAELLRANGVRQEAWYGVWLFADWVEIPDDADAQAVAEVELRAAARDPYRGLSRVFHLVGRQG
ncbi:MAG: methyltransferase domain-containing protein [Pseudonocardia sp.]|uniref:class I SAM-dependent methyltransferase n=1 Tax=unclassified Pseudonocardia TaxID=2619320 RepID=UPI00086A42D6|nr:MULTISPECIES: methyltransferase [unclassified Pseudonocardia]MBN9112010.1 methyltransferase domain-containing protein [Pseudonocardia sp.]ODU25981.1 MAG: SAM-dependent methyltransferase [Pseudonocardia sp. SCN 72-51]ODV06064.1 MAG: SAM-dependent methyltransferase [Pseudonocardia sp. SCN 73-27]